MPDALDLFCGAGGAGLGLTQAGFRVLGVDCDQDAIAVYRQSVGEAFLADVRELNPRTFGQVNLLWASPPCPPWSEARRAQGRLAGFDHPDGGLLFEPLRWSREIGPAWTVIENVDGIPDVVVSVLVDELQKMYSFVTVLRLNAENWVAQRRGHVFIVAGPRPVSVPVGLLHPPRFRDIACGDGAKLVDARHLRYALSKRAFPVPVVGPDDPLPTVTTRPYDQRWTCFVVERPGFVRFPTFLEAARAQGFPDDHPLHVLARERPLVAWRLLGNAVPVPLAHALARVVMEADG